MSYAQVIRDILRRLGKSDIDPRHVEAYIRVEHGTLDSLSLSAFEAEVEIAAECITAGGRDDAEKLARSYGL